MIRKLMASSAILALMSAGAITAAQAQNDPAQPVIVDESTAAAPTTELAASEQVLTPTQPTLASVYIGKSVYSSSDPESDNIGNVNDLIVSEDGTITHAVVGVGGFLGLGQKDVAVPFDELEVVEAEGDLRLIYASSREQLEAAPGLDRTAFDPTVVTSTDVGRDISTTDPMAPAPDMALAPEAPDDAVIPAPSTDMAAAPEPADDALTPAPSTDMAAAPEGDDAMAPADDQAAADVEATPTDQANSMDAPAANEDVVAAGSETAPAEVSTSGGFRTFSADQIRATDLIGQSVYSGEESIGEVSDIIMNDDGNTRAAVIDVGGFLGVGEKPVALPFQDLQISENAEDGVTHVTIAMSREQIEQLPAYELPQQTAAAEPAASLDTTTIPAQPSDPLAEAPVAGGDIVTGSVNPEVTYELATQDLSAESLIGTTVYGTDDANVGEISDVIFDRTGSIEAVVVDVGGFLGMGEKPVAVGFDALNVRTDENGTLVAMINQTQDQLDQAPAYEEPARIVEEPAPAADLTNGGATAPAQ